jgi:hypothetical protein
VSALEYYTVLTGQETVMSPNIATSVRVAARRQITERSSKDYLYQVSEATEMHRGTAGVTTGGGDPAIDYCAGAMGGEDPSIAYAAAMLWYQGYPYSSKTGG